MDQDRLQALGGLGANLPGSQIKDLLIVGVDIESPNAAQLEKDGHYEVGIPLFDTRDVHAIVSAGIDHSALDMLPTHHFYKGNNQASKKGIKSGFDEVLRRFCFGKTLHISQEQLPPHLMIQKLVSGRDIILVVHVGVRDLEFLQAAKLDPKSDSNLLYVLDTQSVAQYPLDLDYRIKLGDLIGQLGIVFDKHLLHVAGNDAHLTIRPLLLTAVLDVCEGAVATLLAKASDHFGKHR